MSTGAATSATARQQRASNPAASAWVSANAGSGKTRVLIDRVARLLLSGADPARILCVTFTKAAAAEMSSRLFKTLGEWSIATDKDLAAALVKLDETGPVDLDEARRLFARALETPGGLKIETIHAFCQRVLQRFPVEAGIAPDFTVLDEREADALVARARAEVFSLGGAAADQALGDAFDTLLGEVGDSVLGDVLTEGIANRSKIEVALESIRDDSALAVAARAGFGLGPNESAPNLLAACHSDPACDQEALKEAASALDQGSTKDAEKAAAIRNHLSSADKTDTFGPYLDVFLTKSDRSPQKRLLTKAAADANGRAEQALLHEQARLIGRVERLRTARTLDLSIAALTILRRMFGRYEELKAKGRKLDYDDLIARTLALLTDTASAWVHFKLDGGVSHVLIDEAQDTSPDQWAIIQALTSEFFAAERAAGERSRTIFAVGDEKQSIFSFQGARPREFASMRARFGLHVERSKRLWAPTELPFSFRSVADILHVVDATFEAGEVRSSLTSAGDWIKHEAVRIGERGLVELWEAHQRTTKDESAHENWILPVDERAETDPEIKLANEVASTIRTLIEGGDGPGDFLVLVRQRGAQFYEMLRALSRAKLPVAGADRMVMTQEIAYLDLDALGRFCLFPQDDLALAEVLRGPFIGLSDEELFRLAHKRTGSLWSALRRSTGEPFIQAREWLALALRRSTELRPFEFYCGCLDDRARQKVGERLGRSAEDVVQEFLALALSYERSEPASLQGFLAFASDRSESIKRDMEEASGRIRVMTVHGAKGLEAANVFLIDTCTKPQTRGKWLFSEAARDLPILRPKKSDVTEATRPFVDHASRQEQDEYLRLLYVAMTRARERLFVAGVAPVRGRLSGSWHELVEGSLKRLGATTAMRANIKALRFGAEPQAPVATLHVRAPDPLEPTWLRATAPGEPSFLRRTPSGMTGPEQDAVPVFAPAPSQTDPFLRGRLIHKLLQVLPDVEAERRRELAARLFRTAAYRTLAGEEADIIDETLRLFEDARFARVFGPGSRAEVAIAGSLQSKSGRRILISGQIDRLVVGDNDILVVDFKTNRPPPRRAADVPRVYINQMASYACLLQKALPGRAVKAGLLYTAVPRLMEVALGAAELEAVTAE